MVFLLAVGAVLMAFGIRLLGMVMQFYQGQRRELYFEEGQMWIGNARLGGALMIGGAGFILGALLQENPSRLPILGTSLAVVVWWLFIPIGLRLLPPGWLRELEHGRAGRDLEAIRLNGATMLKRRPKVFRQMVRDPFGWELWLTSVVHMLPQSALHEYVTRCEIAMEHHMLTLAIHNAEQIIAYRPGHMVGYQLRARALIIQHRYQEAVLDLTRCIQLEPQNAELYYQRARLYYALRKTAAAEYDVRQALRLRPGVFRYKMLYATVTSGKTSNALDG